MLLNLLSDTVWETYLHRKIAEHQDPQYFVPEELWEFNYFAKLLMETNPQLEEMTVILSIKKTMHKTFAPRPRKHFIQMVVKELQQRTSDWENLLASFKGNGNPVFYTDKPFSGN
jgi:hypothetical protein